VPSAHRATDAKTRDGRILVLIASILGRLKEWLGGAARDAEIDAEGGEPVATGMGGSVGEQPERETSTNAQVAGASDEPWPGNE
jgi:hypothetical protein